MPKTLHVGFTLAELLIALAILGMIATFTIPKILGAQQQSQSNTAAKEAASMIAGAYDNYKKDLGTAVPASTTLDALLPYLNYVSRLTTGTMDDHRPNNFSYDCSSASITCLKLHSGGVLFWDNTVNFAGTNTTNANNYIFYDPDGIESSNGIADSPGKSVCFVLYYNGRLTSRANTLTGTVSSAGTYNPGTHDPSWFSW